jgi:hypothetical protein
MGTLEVENDCARDVMIPVFVAEAGDSIYFQRRVIAIRWGCCLRSSHPAAFIGSYDEAEGGVSLAGQLW